MSCRQPAEIIAAVIDKPVRFVDESPKISRDYARLPDRAGPRSTQYPRLRSSRIILAARRCARAVVTAGPRSSYTTPSCKIFHTSRQSRCAIAPIACAWPRHTTNRRYTSSKMLPFVFTAACAA